MLNQKIRHAWDRFMQPVGRALAGLGLTPDGITLAGVVFQVGVAVMILEGRLFVAGLVAIVAGLTDILDGAVAKARGTSGRFGALLDSTIDRLGDALFFLPLAWLYGVSPDIPERDAPVIAALALVTLVASFLVSYVKARAEGLGYECSVGIIERAERVILMVAALLFDLVAIVLAVLAVFSLVTLIQRLLHVRAQASAGT